MSSGKKKGKKSKGQTLNLNDFLAATPSPVIPPGARDEYGNLIVADVALPTAPRSENVGSYDEDKVPNRPPFTAYVGNLPYDVVDMELERFFKNSKIINIRLPSENGSFKGYGYIECEDRDSLINILKCNGTPFHERTLKVDLATGNSRNSADDKTNFNWRLKESGNAYDEQTTRDSRGGFPQTSDADLDQTWVKKGNFESSDRGFGGGGRGGGREMDRGFGRDRDFGRDNDRGGGFNRDGGDRGFGNRDRDGGDRGFGRDRRGYEEDNLSWSRNDNVREQAPENVRKPLVLSKRTKPIEEIKIVQPPPPKPKVEVKRTPQNLFGEAKPVDTATKERMIEDKLYKMNVKVASGRNGQTDSYDDNRDNTEDSKETTHPNQESQTKVYIDAPVPTKSAWGK